jgi:hypothetical protein
MPTEQIPVVTTTTFVAADLPFFDVVPLPSSCRPNHWLHSEMLVPLSYRLLSAIDFCQFWLRGIRDDVPKV